MRPATLPSGQCVADQPRFWHRRPSFLNGALSPSQIVGPPVSMGCICRLFTDKSDTVVYLPLGHPFARPIRPPLSVHLTSRFSPRLSFLLTISQLWRISSLPPVCSATFLVG